MAYGARLESVLGASPRGFESPILRHFLHSSDSRGRPAGGPAEDPRALVMTTSDVGCRVPQNAATGLLVDESSFGAEGNQWNRSPS